MKPTPRLLFPLLVTLCLLAAGAATADEEARYNRISLSVEASADVENDTLVAELFIEHQAKTAAAAALVVNAAVGWGVDKARAAPSVKVRTLDYNTSPVYSQQPQQKSAEPFTPTIVAWRVSQAIRLKSTDADTLSELVTALQERLAIRSIGYEVSTGLRDATNSQLIDEAIKAFQQRAQQIAGGFGRNGYKLVEVNISTGSSRPPVPYRSNARMQMDAPAPVAIDAGSSTLSVTIDGTIELE
ncbi:MAG: SIMPL domain-containing protein [Gammaproteobacteria bacterium]|jgi:predicted secreted protein